MTFVEQRGREERGENINNGLEERDSQGKLKGQKPGNAFRAFHFSCERHIRGSFVLIN